MKALTIHQPYASLIAHGIKRFETRSWYTSYRGKLLIHAAKTTPYTQYPAGLSTEDLEKLGDFANLPKGQGIALGKLVQCLEMVEHINKFHTLDIYKVSHKEVLLGCWEAGRFAWCIKEPQLIPPISIRGKQGLWETETCP